MATVDLYRYDCACGDRSVFLEQRNDGAVCPHCESAHCLESVLRWVVEGGTSATAELAG